MFSALVASYLFLGGTGAGALAALGALECGKHRLALPDELFARAWPACLVALAAGILCLLADIGRPERVINLLLSPTPTVLTIGAYALVIAVAIAAVFALAALLDTVRLPRAAVKALGIAAIAVGVVTATYTGTLLQSMVSVLFWQTPLLPALFLVSSLSCGIACVFGAAAFTETRMPIVRQISLIGRLDGALIVIEALLVTLLLIGALGGEGTARAAGALVSGELRWLFWGGLVVCGLVVPFVLERFLTHGNQRTQLLFIAGFLLAGGLALRLAVLGAASYDVTQMPELLYGLSIE